MLQVNFIDSYLLPCVLEDSVKKKKETFPTKLMIKELKEEEL